MDAVNRREALTAIIGSLAAIATPTLGYSTSNYTVEYPTSEDCDDESVSMSGHPQFDTDDDESTSAPSNCCLRYHPSDPRSSMYESWITGKHREMYPGMYLPYPLEPLPRAYPLQRQ